MRARAFSTAASTATLTATLTAFALVVSPEAARADESRETCMSAAESAQTLQHKGKLTAAKAELLVCARAICPPIVRDDCARWLAQVEEALPSIVVQAHDAAGGQLTDVHVFFDAQPIAEGLDGRAFAVDPGTHVLRVEHGGRSVEQQIVIVEAQKSRLVDVKFEPDVERGTRPVPRATWIFGGVAVAALATSGYFFGQAIRFSKQLDDTHCAPHCNSADVTTLKHLVLYGDVALGVAVASAVGAAIFYLARPRAASAPAVGLAPVPGGAFVSASARF